MLETVEIMYMTHLNYIGKNSYNNPHSGWFNNICEHFKKKLFPNRHTLYDNDIIRVRQHVAILFSIYDLCTDTFEARLDEECHKCGISLGAFKAFRIHYSNILDQFKQDVYSDNYKNIRDNKKLHFWMNSGTLKVSTINSFKGWESEVVFLILEPKYETSTTFNLSFDELLYTGLTRCRCNLVVINFGNQDYDLKMRPLIDKINFQCMPANKNAMTRYKILDELLSSRYHNFSLDDLTKEVSNRLADMYPNTNGVVRRTIEKDIYYLKYEGPFMVEIERYTVQSYNKEKQKHYIKQCLRYAKPSFSIFKKEMTDNEECLLRETLTLLGQFDGLPNFNALEGLRLGLEKSKRRTPIISFTKNPLENSNLLGELFTMISRKLVIELRYHTFNAPKNILSINLYPYFLKEYNRRWYIFGTAEEDEKLLSFSLDRINSIKPLASHKYIEYSGDFNEIFEDIIGVTLYEDSPIYQIYFWVSDLSKDYVATKPLHESQKQIGGSKDLEFRNTYAWLNGGQIFRIDCKCNYELIRELCPFGKDLLVLSPKEI